MKIVDLYIIRKFLGSFFFVCLIFTMISVVIDFSENVDDFMEAGIDSKTVITEYYLNFIPWINGILWPLFALMAVVFFTSRLAKNSEIIAMLSSGVNYWRLLVPFLITGILIAGLHYIGSHSVIPRGNKKFMTFKNTVLKPGSAQILGENIHIFLDQDSKIYMRVYHKEDTSARDVFLERFEDDKLVYLLKAKQLEWKGHPNHWQFRDYSIHRFDGEEESLVTGTNQILDTTLNLVPADFTRYANQKEMMTSREIRDFIAYEKAKGISTARKMMVELHRRNADPFTIVILVLIGFAVASRKVRGGIGLHLAVGICIGAAYILMSRFSITFAEKLDLPTGLSIWLPNIIFSLVAVYLIVKAQK